jgi:hypothetical protein
MDLAGCFIKVGQLEHMLDLILNGHLFCRPINCFPEIEDNNLRGDKLEDVVDMVYMESGEVILGNPNESLHQNGIKMPFKDARLTSKMVEGWGNLFCLYKINLLDKPIGKEFRVDIKMKEFGDYFVLISDPHEFLKRVSNTLSNLKLSFLADVVKYLDLSKYTGKKSVFQKDIKYEYQQEYRIFIKNKKVEPLSIRIGSIEDISILCKSANFDNLIIRGEKKDDLTFRILSNLRIKQETFNI